MASAPSAWRASADPEWLRGTQRPQILLQRHAGQGIPDAAWADLMVSGPTLRLRFRAGGLGPLVNTCTWAIVPVLVLVRFSVQLLCFVPNPGSSCLTIHVLSPCRPITRTFKLGAEPTIEQGSDQEGRPAQAPTGSELERWRDGLEKVPVLWSSLGALRGGGKSLEKSKRFSIQCQASTSTGTSWTACRLLADAILF
ncbi:hypothetical protein TgHK011_005108 [Trichoderma gracile]|nr:hypothetical protein TgHK011_005108 [Trichoderma gracile]